MNDLYLYENHNMDIVSCFNCVYRVCEGFSETYFILRTTIGWDYREAAVILLAPYL